MTYLKTLRKHNASQPNLQFGALGPSRLGVPGGPLPLRRILSRCRTSSVAFSFSWPFPPRLLTRFCAYAYIHDAYIADVTLRYLYVQLKTRVALIEWRGRVSLCRGVRQHFRARDRQRLLTPEIPSGRRDDGGCVMDNISAVLFPRSALPRSHVSCALLGYY